MSTINPMERSRSSSVASFFLENLDIEAKTSSFAAIFIVSNAAIGVGTLNFPQAFALCGGLPVGIPLLFFCALVCSLALSICAFSMEEVKGTEFFEASRFYMGYWAELCSQIALLFSNVGTCILYLVIVGDQTSIINYRIFGEETFCGSNYWILRRRFMICLLGCLIVLPISLRKSIDFLKYPSLITVFSMLYVVVAVVIEYFTKDHDDADIQTAQFPSTVGQIWALREFENVNKVLPPVGSSAMRLHIFFIPVTCAGFFVRGSLGYENLEKMNVRTVISQCFVRPDNWIDIFNAFPTILLAYQCMTNSCPVFGNLENKSPRSYAIVIAGTVGLCTLIYLPMAIFGYLSFGSDVASNILQAYDATDNLMFVGQITVMLAVMMSYPVINYVNRNAIDPIYVNFRKYRDPSYTGFSERSKALRRYSETAFFFVICLLAALVVPDVGIAVDFTGSFAVYFYLLFPGLFIIQTTYLQNSKFKDRPIATWVLRVTGTVCCVLAAFLFGQSFVQACYSAAEPQSSTTYCSDDSEMMTENLQNQTMSFHKLMRTIFD